MQETKTTKQSISKGELAIKVIIDCTITAAHKFRPRLGFKQCNVISFNKQQMLTKIINSFEKENMQIQYDRLKD